MCGSAPSSVPKMCLLPGHIALVQIPSTTKNPLQGAPPDSTHLVAIDAGQAWSSFSAS